MLDLRQGWPLLFLALGFQAVALPLEERWIIQRAPSESEIERWERAPATIKFFWRAESDPIARELGLWERVAGRHQVSIQTTRMPSETTAQAWTSLAARAVEPVFWNVQLPIQREIDFLNRIGFKSAVWFMDSYPGTQAGQILRGWKTRLQISFGTGKFPRFVDRESLKALPPDAVQLYMVDQWPWYEQMDLFNLLPQPKKIRVIGYYPSPSHWEYLNHIRDLVEIQLMNKHVPKEGAEIWNRFGDRSVTWNLQDWVPTRQQLLDFVGSASNPRVSRKVFYDSDFPMSTETRSLFESLPCSVEWIHAIR